MKRDDDTIEMKLNPDEYVPALSLDCVVLAYRQGQLCVLLLKWKNSSDWSLPGGFVKIEEDVDTAAHRVLKGRTSLDISFLKQLQVFGSPQRRNLDYINQHLKTIDIDESFRTWIQQRFISIAYLALVNADNFTPIPDQLSEACVWKPLDQLPPLLFDHQEMIDRARAYLKIQIKYLPIGLSLLPPKFTMKTLQHLYEAVLDQQLDRANFQKKILKLGILIRHEKQMSGGAHKAPFLYSFNESKYKEFRKSGIGFI